MILRFIAFLNNVNNINSNTEKFLDEFMEKAVKDVEFDIEYYENMFVKVMSILADVCDYNIFRNERNAFVPAYYVPWRPDRHGL